MDLLRAGAMEQDPQQPPEAMDFLRAAANDFGREHALRASGVLEHVGVGTTIAAKTIADGITHAGTLGAKALYGAGSFVTGNGFGAGWNEVEQQMLKDTGTTSPGAMELFSSITGVGKGAGQEVEEWGQQKLGNYVALPKTIGFVTSMAVGPGAAIGRGGQAIAAPLTAAAERIAAKSLLKTAGVTGQAAKDLIQQGRAWEAIAAAPQLSGALGTAMKVVGGNIRPFMDMTAANIAQSYAMSPDDERSKAALGALIFSVPMYGVAKVGQTLQSKILAGAARNFSPEKASKVKQIIADYEVGKITENGLIDGLKSQIGMDRRAVAAMVSAAGEGTAMTMLSPDAWDSFNKWRQGDADAGTSLVASMLGNMAVFAALKHHIPMDVLPQFKRVRPDLNRLNTLIEAEAAKRTALEADKEPAAPAEPQNPLGEPLTPEQVEAQRQKLHAKEVDRQVGLAEPANPAEHIKVRPPKPDTGPAEPAVGPRAQDPASMNRPAGAQPYNPRDAKLQANTEALQREYGWADGPTIGLLHSGWDSKLEPEGRVKLTFAEDHSVTLHNGGEGLPIPTIEVPTHVEQALQSFGVRTLEFPERTSDQFKATYSGESARQVLDSLAMLGAIRKLQGDLTLQRMNLRQRDDGTWIDDLNGRVYKAQLDGSFATAENGRETFDGRQEIESVGGFEQPKFDSPQTQMLEQWLLRKQALAPDALTDSLFAQVLASARNGDTSTAQAMRDLLMSTDQAALAEKLRPGADRILAHDLAAVAIGMDNPVHTMTGWGIEGQSKMSERLADRGGYDRRKERIAQFEERRAKAGQGEGTVHPRESVPTERPEPVVEPQGEPQPRNVLPEAVRQERRAAEREPATEGTEPMPRGPRQFDDGSTIAETRSRRYPGSEALAMMAMDPTGHGAATAIGLAAAYGLYRGARRWYAKPANKAKVAGWLRKMRTEQPRFFERLSKAGASEFSTAVKRQVQRRADIESQAQLIGKDVRAAYKAVPREERLSMVPLDPQHPEYGSVPAAVLAADGKLTTGKWGAFGKQAQKLLHHLWSSQAKAGMVREERDPQTGKMVHVPLDPNRTIHVVQRKKGKDFGVIMADDALRMQAAKAFIASNKPHYVIDPTTKQRRQMTAADLDARWKQEFVNPDTKVDLNKAEGDSAAEHLREFAVVPYKIGDKELFDTSVMDTLAQQIRTQSARAAEVEMHGQKLPEAERAALLQQPNLSPEHRNALQNRFGVDAAYDKWRTTERAGVGDTTIDKALVETGKDILVDIGGRPRQSMGAFMRMWSSALSVYRSAKTATSFVHDVPEMFTRPMGEGRAWEGFTSALRTLWSPKESVLAAQRLGAIDDAVISELVGDTSTMRGVPKALSEAWGSGSHFFEKLKQASFAGLGAKMVKNWKSGEVAESDRFLLDEMGFTPAETGALLSGKAEAITERQFIRQFMQKLASRSARHEGSYGMQSPMLNAMVSFVHWPVKRMTDYATGAARILKALHARDMRAFRIEGTRFGKKLLGAAVAGPIGLALSYMIADTFNGEGPLAGAERFWRDISNYTLKTAGKAILGQITGGPFMQLFNAVEDPNNPYSWATMFAPGAVLYSVGKAVQYFRNDDMQGVLRELTTGIGLAPKPLHDIAAAAYAASQNIGQSIADERLTRAFDRLEGIKRPFGERKRDPAFYESIKKAVSAIESAGPDESKQLVIDRAMENIREALQLAPEESVAATVESYMHLRPYDNEQQVKFAEYIGDDARLREMARHDEALQTFAKAVRLKEGVNPTPWEKDLQNVAIMANLGFGDRWRGLAERAVEETAQRIEADGPFGTQIQELADRMALHPEQIAKLFDERTQKAMLSGNLDTETIARRVAANLRNRVKASRSKLRDRAREEQKRNG